MRRSILLIAVVASAAALAGCGQKGPLVMAPATPAATATPHPAAQPASSATSMSPARASSTISPYNPILHQ